MSTHAKRAGLWSVEGPGVLAREDDLVLLAGLTASSLVDRLLDLLAETAESGGDGLRFARAVEDILDADGAWRVWRAGQEGPALVAFGPAGPGLAVAVTGGAWLEITTVAGTQRIAAGPSMLLHCLVGSPVLAAQGGLRSDAAGRAHTDRFSRLDAGVVRAGGFSYHAGQPASPAAAQPAGAGPGAAAAPPADEPRHAAASPVGAAASAADPVTETAEPSADAPAPAEAGLVAGVTGAEPVVERPRSAVNSPVAAPGGEALLPGGAAPPFDSVLLLGDQVAGEAEGRPPLPAGSGRPGPADGASAPAEILGVYCKNGHFDDPEARFCAVCGISMNQQTLVPRPGSRPPLGLLVLDGGAVYQLDADYVVGREPTLDAAVAAGKARPLRVTDGTGTVSRVHAKVELDGWRVLVSDLGSANGTMIRQPSDSAGQQLTPRVPVRLVPGNYIDLGGAGFHYESHRGR